MKRLTLFFLFLLTYVNFAFGSTITLVIKDSSGVDRTSKYVSYGIPLSMSDNAVSISTFKISTDEAGTSIIDAQFNIISRYDLDGDGWEETEPIRTVLLTFPATVSANMSSTYYFHTTDGSGNVAGDNLADNSNEAYCAINASSLLLHVKKTAGFNLFDQVTVDSTDIVSSPATDGIILTSDNGGETAVDYTSFSSNNAPTVSIVYNGPLMAVVKVAGHLEDSSNNTLIPSGENPSAVNPISYAVWYTLFKDERYIKVDFRIKNENPGAAGYETTTNRNIEIANLYLKTTLAGLGTVTEIDFSDWSDLTSPSGVYDIEQDHCLPGACAQASESDAEAIPNFNYYIKSDVSGTPNTEYTGRRFDSYSQIRDSDRGLIVAGRWCWQNWPFTIKEDATNKITEVHLLPNTGTDHILMGAAWKTWQLIYDFHADVASDYTFDSELAQLKYPFVIFPSNLTTSNFFGERLGPASLTTSITYSGGESLDDAITNQQNSIRAQFDSTYSTNESMLYDIFDLMESRPKTSTTGIYNGPIDWYGWQHWGDLVRDELGFGALNYDWNYFASAFGNCFQDLAMVYEGDAMSLRTADSLILHQPINDTTTINTSGATVRDLHGGSRDEYNATCEGTSFLTGFQNNGCVTNKHQHLIGLIFNYILTGDDKLFDGLKDAGDFIRHNYSSIAPDHGVFDGATSVPEKRCDLGTCTYYNTVETRQFSRSIEYASLLYQSTGDTDYLTLAKKIFENALLQNEDAGGGSLGSDSGSVYVWYTDQALRPAIALYNLLYEVGDSYKSSVSAWLLRLVSWYDNVFDNYLLAQPGYGTGENEGKYLAYTQGAELISGAFSGLWHPEYITEVADLYAFAYLVTNEQEYLDRAARMFTDKWFYAGQNTYETINNIVEAAYANDGPAGGDAWLKEGISLMGGNYFLWVKGRSPLVRKINGANGHMPISAEGKTFEAVQ